MPSTLQIDLADVLPDVPSAEDPCARRLSASLGEHTGVTRAHVTEAAPGEAAKLCVHYDSDRAGETHLRKAACGTGRRLTEQFRHGAWETPSIRDAEHARRIEKALRRMTGVVDVQASEAGTVRVGYNQGQVHRAEIRGGLALMGLRLEA
ncbi:hypothetical protein [Salinibacter altiplanensis]|uniref:hypothetical protein n=1 Tax=Salinibacter altiplanensis TaxID=1803181 RepID=UPI00130012C0|nr:hypothetical protein [Salinibacter altiplanensis]